MVTNAWDTSCRCSLATMKWVDWLPQASAHTARYILLSASFDYRFIVVTCTEPRVTKWMADYGCSMPTQRLYSVTGSSWHHEGEWLILEQTRCRTVVDKCKTFRSQRSLPKTFTVVTSYNCQLLSCYVFARELIASLICSIAMSLYDITSWNNVLPTIHMYNSIIIINWRGNHSARNSHDHNQISTCY